MNPKQDGHTPFTFLFFHKTCNIPVQHLHLQSNPHVYGLANTSRICKLKRGLSIWKCLRFQPAKSETKLSCTRLPDAQETAQLAEVHSHLYHHTQFLFKERPHGPLPNPTLLAHSRTNLQEYCRNPSSIHWCVSGRPSNITVSPAIFACAFLI